NHDGDLSTGWPAPLSPAARHPTAACAASGRGGKRLAVKVLSAGGDPCCCAFACRSDGRKPAAVGGVGGGSGVSATVRRVGMEAVDGPARHDVIVIAATPCRQPSAASAVVHVKPAFGILAVIYAVGATAGTARRSAGSLAAAVAAGKPQLLSDQYRD